MTAVCTRTSVSNAGTPYLALATACGAVLLLSAVTAAAQTAGSDLPAVDGYPSEPVQTSVSPQLARRPVRMTVAMQSMETLFQTWTGINALRTATRGDDNLFRADPRAHRIAGAVRLSLGGVALYGTIHSGIELVRRNRRAADPFSLSYPRAAVAVTTVSTAFHGAAGIGSFAAMSRNRFDRKDRAGLAGFGAYQLVMASLHALSLAWNARELKDAKARRSTQARNRLAFTGTSLVW